MIPWMTVFQFEKFFNLLEAAELMRKDLKGFIDYVKKTLKGLQYKSVYFPKMV